MKYVHCDPDNYRDGQDDSGNHDQWDTVEICSGGLRAPSGCKLVLIRSRELKETYPYGRALSTAHVAVCVACGSEGLVAVASLYVSLSPLDFAFRTPVSFHPRVPLKSADSSTSKGSGTRTQFCTALLYPARPLPPRLPRRRSANNQTRAKTHPYLPPIQLPPPLHPHPPTIRPLRKQIRQRRLGHISYIRRHHGRRFRRCQILHAVPLLSLPFHLRKYRCGFRGYIARKDSYGGGESGCRDVAWGLRGRFTGRRGCGSSDGEGGE